MNRIAIAFAIAAFALAPAGPASAAAQQNPWEFFKELMHAAPVRLPPPRRAAETPATSGAAEAGRVAVPLPRPRPHRAADPPAPIAETIAAAPPAEPEMIPLGPPRAEGGVGPAFPFPVARPKHEADGIAPLAMFPPAVFAPVITAPKKRDATCAAALGSLGVVASQLAPIEEGRCTVADPVAVSALAGGVDLSNKAIVDCAVARHLAAWLAADVQPNAARTGGRVTGLRVAASYECRNRNRLATGKLSEHGHGNAIDISAFEIDGKRWIEVGSGWGNGADGDFLKAVRQSACGPFTTVLGPGSDAYHSDHIHLDLAERRTAGPSHGLYCK